MKAETYIISEWRQEVVKQEQQQQDSKKERYAAYKEFKESICDLFDMRDFHYYAERIGCNVIYLMRIAKYSHSLEYQKYEKPGRDLSFRRQFYIEHGHSITKPNLSF